MDRKRLSSYFLFFITIMAANIFVMMIVAALITMFGYGEYITWQGKENGFGLYLILFPFVLYYGYKKILPAL